MASTKRSRGGGSHDTCIQFRLPVLPADKRLCRAGSSFAPPPRASRQRRSSPPALVGEAQAATKPTQAGRPILIKGGCVLSLDSAVGDFEQADVLIEGKKISAVKPNISAPNAQVIDASNRIVMPGFVDTHRHMWQGFLRNVLPDGSLEDYRNVVQRTFGAKMIAGRCLCRRLHQRARRDRRRRHLHPRLVAHPEFAGAHRRLHQGTAGIRACGRCSPMAPARTRPAGSWRLRPPNIPATSRGCASNISPATTSSSRSISRRWAARPKRPCRSSRPRATSAPASPSMSASASSAATRCWRSSTPRRRSRTTPPTSTAARSTTPSGS